MSIKVYKGTEPEANKASENRIANTLTGNLLSRLQDSTIDYTIIKYPTIKNQSFFGGKAFYPDFIIACPSQILIIDFKECGGHLLPPNGREGLIGSPWLFTDKGTSKELKGGNHGNPYRQVTDYAKSVEYRLNLSREDDLLSSCVFFYGGAKGLDPWRQVRLRKFSITGEDYPFVEDILNLLSVKRDKTYDLDRLLSAMSLVEEKDQKIIGPEILEHLESKEKELSQIRLEREQHLKKIAQLEQDNLYLRDENAKQKNTTDMSTLKQQVQQNNIDLEKAENDLKKIRKETLEAKNLKTKAEIEKQKAERQRAIADIEKSREKQAEYELQSKLADLEFQKQLQKQEKTNRKRTSLILLTIVVILGALLLIFALATRPSTSPLDTPHTNTSTEVPSEEPETNTTSSSTSESPTTPPSDTPQTPQTQETTSTPQTQETPVAPETPVTPPATTYKAYVYDGDTISVYIDGVKTSVRLIGVDAPEIQSDYRDKQCWGYEAKNYLYNLIGGKEITLEADPTQDDTDAYGRLLRYVYYNGELVNHSLVYNGYAREYTYRYAYRHQASFRDAQEYAKRNQLGLWNPTNCPN